MTGDILMTLIMFGLFMTLFSLIVVIKWYNKKHSSKINSVWILLILFALILVGSWVLIKKSSTSQKSNIIQTVSLENKVVEINWENRKPYFKEMKMDDGRLLPMPEEMNSILNVNDSIYKNIGEE